ncbi:unnamed protein product, partial [Musa textilis]
PYNPALTSPHEAKQDGGVGRHPGARRPFLLPERAVEPEAVRRSRRLLLLHQRARQPFSGCGNLHRLVRPGGEACQPETGQRRRRGRRGTGVLLLLSDAADPAADELFEEGIIRTVMPSWVESGGGGAPRTVEDGLRGGRGRRTLSSSSGASPRVRRASASLSSLGGGCEGELPRPPSSSQAASALAKGGGSKKWKFSDLFLFRSASEGRATGRGSKDPLRKYTLPVPSSTKRANGGGSTRRGSGSSPSAHEIYYSANRAAAEEQKRKQMTPLAYQRHGLFGYLRDNPAIHSITKGLGGSSLFSRRQP